jgi:excinuclease ABC subunit A
MSADSLKIVGARENNLKNLDLEIPHDRLIAITGVSGSGKSTLAIDTIHAEGGRRYIETFSPYTRQFLDRLKEPDVTSIHNVRPSLVLEQRNRITSSRSTVGTITEINEYLKIVWPQLAKAYCPKCSIEISYDSPTAVRSQILRQAGEFALKAVVVGFGINVSKDVSVQSLAAALSSEGFTKLLDGETGTINFAEEISPPKKSKQMIVVVDRFTPEGLKTQSRLTEAINHSFTFGKGELFACFVPSSGSPEIQKFSEKPVCKKCGYSAPIPKPATFSFNSPLGACRCCNGFGRILTFTESSCVPNPSLSIEKGALQCWNGDAASYERSRLKELCTSIGIDQKKPWSTLTAKQREQILNGSKEHKFRGVIPWLKALEKKKHRMHVRIFLARFRKEVLCPDCLGSRLRPETALFKLDGQTLPDLWQIPLEKLYPRLQRLLDEHSGNPAVAVPLEEVCSRLRYLVEVGLGYLNLDRQSRTLSGGESQRVGLTSILGSRLVNTMLVLDEPTIGLHQTDTERLIKATRQLQSRGNTVIVVEHDREFIKSVDEIIDIGPHSGEAGGEIIYQGPVEGLRSVPASLTGRYLFDTQTETDRVVARKGKKECLEIVGATSHNLKNLRVQIPLHGLTVLTGVSGSGKSTLINNCLVNPYKLLSDGLSWKQIREHDSCGTEKIDGLEKIDEIVLVDQSALGKTPRANPATYTKLWDIIRDRFAETDGAIRLGLPKSAFSFNVDGGRCPVCSGAGYERIEMQFLADVFVPCETCGGTRFQDRVLEVTLAGKNVAQWLNTSLEESVKLIEQLDSERASEQGLKLIQPLIDLGLGYLRLGHPLSELSGGEAQRLKLASYLSDSSKGKKCLIVLDEPTTGLHPHNVIQLVNCLRRLIDVGHSVLCVEHNLDIIRAADWMIDLGPDAGERGGEIVVEGDPLKLVEDKVKRSRSRTLVALAAEMGVISKTDAKSAARVKVQEDPHHEIEIIGARHHNLKNISVKIPHNQLTVVTGVSGSGKSSLAFDIVFAEGQRRYIDCLSPYARQFIKQLTRAEVDRIYGIPPTIAVSQRTRPPAGLSTIATVTEVYQFLRLLYSKVGDQHCPYDNSRIATFSAEAILQELENNLSGKRIFIFAPVISGRKGYYNDLFQRAYGAEITEARVDGKIIKIDAELRLERHKLHWISLLVGSVKVAPGSRDILNQALQQALSLSGGSVEIAVEDKWAEPSIYSTDRICPTCKRGFIPLDPQDFSFRSARGKCSKCDGYGTVEVKGKNQVCPECAGTRLKTLANHVYIGGLNIAALTEKTAPLLLHFLKEVKFSVRVRSIVAPILKELESRLNIITGIGLDYLALNRDAASISGGEAQRLRLAKTLGAPLTGVCYVLDEPSIGLHPKDHRSLMETLFKLRDANNTLVVVEHDETTINAADHIIDIGPGGGTNGGKLVCSGTVDEIKSCNDSVTGAELAKRARGSVEVAREAKFTDWLRLESITTNNLKGIDVAIPLRALTTVAGVSGAGKSSLLHNTIYPAVVESITEEPAEIRSWGTISNAESINRIVEIDQSPVGKNPSSTPASFIGIFDEIRKIFAELPEAKTRGWTASHFSYNTGKGRCPECEGKGFIKVPMSFLPDATTVCEACDGKRYNDTTLEVTLYGLSMGDLLELTFEKSLELFTAFPKIKRTVEIVVELGLGYLSLGQPTFSLSGGELQRLKIAKELRSTESKDTLYLMDEPTVGLHMADVGRLMTVLRKLVEKGNTIVLIEHDLDFIRGSDYIVEIGPDAGEKGGKLVFSGTPAELLNAKVASPTRDALLVTGSKKVSNSLKSVKPRRRTRLNEVAATTLLP